MSEQPELPTVNFPQTVVLVGFMGSGKSSVARLLAESLRCPAIDLDKHIVQLTGCTITEIFVTRGEPAFRQLETQTLRSALQTPSVIATGGGTLTRQENRDLLRSARNRVLIIYLRASAATLTERIRRQPGKRPLIDGDSVLDDQATRARVEQLLAQRAGYYESLADVIIDTDALCLSDIVHQLECVLEHRVLRVR